jgi:hypothetical protein
MIGNRQRAEPRITRQGRAETAITGARTDLIGCGITPAM